MSLSRFARSIRIDAPVEDLFAWHERPGAFERLSPPWERVEILSRSGGIEDGARVRLRLGKGPIRIEWDLVHRDFVPGRRFRDTQVSGPFRVWSHTHEMIPEGATASRLLDTIEFGLPVPPLGDMIGGGLVRSQLDRLFRYRHAITAGDLAAHAGSKGVGAMKILVSGSTGLVGSALVPFLTSGGHSVVRLVRRGPAEDRIEWNPERGTIDAARLEGFDCVVHLAGESVAGRWTEEKKRRILESRVRGTRLLCESLARCARPPRVLVCASAVGYYGNRGEEILREESLQGGGFLARVVGEWEAAAAPARDAGIRVVHPRIGIVLSGAGGALAKMLPPFRLGLGGPIGSGRQSMSWIAIDDLLDIILRGATDDSLSGPVNAVAPQAVTNGEFSRTLARVLRRPCIFRVPGVVLRLALGEAADEMLLGGARVEPAKLLAEGHRYRHPNLEGALRHLLGVV